MTFMRSPRPAQETRKTDLKVVEMLKFNLVIEKATQLRWVPFDLALLDMLVQPQSREVAVFVFLALRKVFLRENKFSLT